MQNIALVHDYLTQYGGAERVLSELCLLFPNAPIYTLLYDEKMTGRAFADRTIYTSSLQKVPRSPFFHRFLALWMPLAIEQFDLSAYDIVVSSSASFGKGILTREYTHHICYCHTPMRSAWMDYKDVIGSSLYPQWLSTFFPLLLPYMRLWDRSSAQRVDTMLCNSYFIQQKIERYYHRNATVVYPPVSTGRFSIGEAKDYFLLVGRMLPYKRFDIAVEACTALKLPLVVVGNGPEYPRLKKMAGDTITFLGRVSDDVLRVMYSQARAFLVPQEEDFGISPIESLASGRPVIAYRAGGALEYVKEGENGLLFGQQNAMSLQEALIRFDRMVFDPETVRKTALRFDRSVFHNEIVRVVRSAALEQKRSVIQR